MYGENDIDYSSDKITENEIPENIINSDGLTKEEYIKNAVSKFINSTSLFQARDNETTAKKASPYKASLSCSFCQKVFNKRQGLERHELVHTGVKSFKCDKCDKSFALKNSLNLHTRNIHNLVKIENSSGDISYKPFEKNFSCYRCSKQFAVKSKLELHERIHTGEKPFKCDLCDKFFTQRSQLLIHKKRHSGIKPFSCDLCGKTFLLEYYLNLHWKVHTRERPFSCDVCGKGFPINSLLQNHKRRHTEKPTFACDFCEKAFYDKGIKMLLIFIKRILYDF